MGAVSSAAVLVRLADEAPALTIAAYRMLFGAAALVLMAVVLLLLRRDRLPRGSAYPAMILSGALLAGHFWSWFASLERTSLGSSVVIVATQPLLAAILAVVFLRERPTRTDITGIAVAAIGLGIIGGRDFVSSPGELGGDLLALLGALLVAAYRTVGRALRPEMSATMYSAVVYTVAAVCLWGLVAGLRPEVGGFEGKTWGYLVLLALLPQVVGHTAFNWAIRHFRVVTVSLANMGEPLLATLLAIPILSEDPTWAVIAGAPFILAGVVIGLWGSAPIERSQGPSQGSGPRRPSMASRDSA